MSHKHRHCPQWTIVESSLIPMLTPEQVAAANAADLARASRPPRRPRPPQQCTVGCGHSANGKRTPALRLGGRWMEELGFTIGSTLRVQVRDGELVVSVARETGSD
ncbi:SymE family type I addiction module toxin [Xanthomonas indica]|uniref:SymE family type I addiction module toxin n=1 Tax=Xanthomonas indica TaxID=2912242 RepID=A0AAU8I465_9XANT|nr:SymE family type I addiction module toxin [Xanthomonas indica]MCI2263390.1 type I toxin-antitoxin system SymE family toxin [Xanthomonas indica]